MRGVLIALALVFGLAAAPDPADRLPDPAQEARARSLFAEFRCLVCQNESIDDSDAPLASDLRRLVREQVSAGQSDTEIRSYLIERYGEFVLLRPQFTVVNLALWTAPFLIVGAGVFMLARRRRRDPELLSADEERRLREIVTGEGA